MQNRKRVLFIDDSPVMLRNLQELVKEKYDVDIAVSGNQALRQIAKNRPDIIFLDYEMPHMSGKETLEEIRKQDGGKNIPVVFLTSMSTAEHVKTILELKPAGYLLKPAPANKIFEAIIYNTQER